MIVIISPSAIAFWAISDILVLFLAQEMSSEKPQQTPVESTEPSNADEFQIPRRAYAVDNDGDSDLWCGDGSSYNVSDDVLSKTSDLDREWESRQNQFHTIGYRDGLTAGKEESAQEGFVTGFKQSVLVGYKWGHVRGISSGLALLPDYLREKLIREPETSKRFQNLYASVSSISSKDAVQMFHEDIMGSTQDSTYNHVEDKTRITTIPDEISGYKQLGRFSKQLESLLPECPCIEVHAAAEKNAIA